MKRYEITTYATVTIAETWRVDVADDVTVDQDTALDLLDGERGSPRFLREQTLGDERDREARDVTEVEIPPEHDARPDDLPEPGDRCKDCGENITWIGPGIGDWEHSDFDESPFR